MIEIRPSEKRGHTQLDWLDSRHTFSFDRFYDPEQVQFRSLRVLNEDRVAPGAGFPTHPHRDMEIVTYVLEGALEHRDSMGNGSVIRPGEIQKMSAGTGITHSEFNPSPSGSVHFLQIWILPERRGLAPSYEEYTFAQGDIDGKWAHLAGREAPVTIHQDVDLYAARLAAGQKIDRQLAPGRYAWVQVTRGEVQLNGHKLRAGDGANVAEETALTFHAEEPSELLFFDLG